MLYNDFVLFYFHIKIFTNDPIFTPILPLKILGHNRSQRNIIHLAFAEAAHASSIRFSEIRRNDCLVKNSIRANLGMTILECNRTAR